MRKLIFRRKSLISCLLLSIFFTSLVFFANTSNSLVQIQEPELDVLLPAGDPQFTVEEIGQYDDGGEAQGVIVVGDYAYVADMGDGLEIINVTDPTAPVEVGQVDDGGEAEDVFVVGNYAYVAD